MKTTFSIVIAVAISVAITAVIVGMSVEGMHQGKHTHDLDYSDFRAHIHDDTHDHMYTYDDVLEHIHDDSHEHWISNYDYEAHEHGDDEVLIVENFEANVHNNDGNYHSPRLQVYGLVNGLLVEYDKVGIDIIEEVNKWDEEGTYLYPFIVDADDMIILADGDDRTKVGSPASAILNSDKSLDQIFSEIEEKGYTWISYKFNNPATDTVQTKNTLLIIHDDFMFGAGYYEQ